MRHFTTGTEKGYDPGEWDIVFADTIYEKCLIIEICERVDNIPTFTALLRDYVEFHELSANLWNLNAITEIYYTVWWSILAVNVLELWYLRWKRSTVDSLVLRNQYTEPERSTLCLDLEGKHRHESLVSSYRSSK